MKLQALLGCVAVAAGAMAADIMTVEEIIAKVNGDIVTRSELDRGRRQLEAELRRAGAAGPTLQQELTDKGKDVLRDRIDQLLLVQRGKELNINVDPEVSKQIAAIQLESKIADPDKFAAFVKEQTGQTLEDYRQEMRNAFLTQRVIRQEVGGKISIPRAEVEKYYEEHKKDFVREEAVYLREVLVSTEGKDPAGIAAAEKKAKDLAARAKKGEKFGDLARDFSDAQTSKRGGDLGLFKKGDLNKMIENIVFAQDRGFVSDPIRVDNGFLILRVEERYKAGQAELADVENEIMERLYSPRMGPAVREFLTRLRNEAFLEIKPGFLDTAAAPGKDTTWTDPAQLKPETVTKEEVAAQKKRRRLLWAIPIPGTSTASTGSSRSK